MADPGLFWAVEEVVAGLLIPDAGLVVVATETFFVGSTTILFAEVDGGLIIFPAKL